ncbi:hypothetical protein LTR95_015185 [Oleoguttula sp. CCFEE 5521]
MEDVDEAVKAKDPETGKIEIDQIDEALITIKLCIDHQKNIVDNVLSHSKLDCSMLSLNPTRCRPDTQLRRMLNMFRSEFRKQVIQFEYRIDTDYKDLDVSWVVADWARVSQIMIDLITNAIKFTVHKEGDKEIVCKISAAQERSTSYPLELVVFLSESHVHRLDATDRQEWGLADPFYDMVATSDSGIAISDEGKSKLFGRFRQATPKTGDVYGGSGLGLNISRKLVHLHGGERRQRCGHLDTEQVEMDSRFRGQIRVSQTEIEKGGADTPDPSLRRPRTVGENSQTLKDGREDQATKSEAESKGEQVSRLSDETVEKDDAALEHVRSAEQLEGNGLKKGKKDVGQEQGQKVDEKRTHEQETGEYHSGKRKSAIETSMLEETNMSLKGKCSRDTKRKADDDTYLASKQNDSLDHQDDSKVASERLEAQDNGKTKSNKESTTPQKNSKDRVSNDRKPHILLVEDNIINQGIVLRKLAVRGFRVVATSNGKEAVEYIEQSFAAKTTEESDTRERVGDGSREEKNVDPVDLILMDQEMPIMVGNAAAREIRRIEGERREGNGDSCGADGKSARNKGRVPIIGVSANVREEQLAETLDHGMDAAITKPYEIEEMVGRIREMLAIEAKAKVDEPR